MFGLKDRYVYVDVGSSEYKKDGSLTGALVKKGWRRGTVDHTFLATSKASPQHGDYWHWRNRYYRHHSRYFVVDWDDSNDSTTEKMDQYHLFFGD